MIENQVIPDWQQIRFEAGRFEVIHGLLNEFEQDLAKAGEIVDRSPYMDRCKSAAEKEIVNLEMDYLVALNRNPVKVIGGYLIIRTVGIGGFGSVLLAVDGNGQEVAIKVPHLSWRLGLTRDELDQEAMLLKELQHPNIVRFVESGFDEEWYLVTEWVNGHTLADAMQRVRAPIDQWLDVFSQVCEALAFGHRLGVVHRDINPRNIMVTGDVRPTAKVLDYGIAKRQSAVRQTSDHVAGTIRYLAPEQVAGKYDLRSDIYSLGVSLNEVMIAHCGCDGNIPRPVTQLIRRATARNPERRFQSALEMKEEIETVRNKLKTATPVRGMAPRRGVRTAAMAFGLGAMLFAAWWLAGGAGLSGKGSALPAIDASKHSKLASLDSPDGILVNPVTPLKAVSTLTNASPVAVVLDSVPTGAEIVLYAMDRDGPVAVTRRQAGSAPARLQLVPGDYFVQAIWPDGHWTETLRRVPCDEQSLPPPFTVFSTVKITKQGLELAPLVRPNFQSDGMVKMDEFWIDEMPTLFKSDGSAGASMHSFERAVHVLERQGKRLPFALELDKFSEIKEGTPNETSLAEWTATLGDIRLIPVHHPNGVKSLHLSTTYEVANADENPPDAADAGSRKSPQAQKPAGFRGLRSTSPFGKPGSGD
jgi:Protein kinase domain